MADKSTITVRISLAWWFRWYLAGVVLMQHMTGMAIHRERFGFWMRRAIRITRIA